MEESGAQETVVPEYDTSGAALEEPADLAVAGVLARLHARAGSPEPRVLAAAGAALLLLLLLVLVLGGDDPPQLDIGTPAETPQQRTDKLLAMMSLDQKMSMMHGGGALMSPGVILGGMGLAELSMCGDCPYGDDHNLGKCMSGHVCSPDGIPTIFANDGPQGFRAAIPVGWAWWQRLLTQLALLVTLLPLCLCCAQRGHRRKRLCACCPLPVLDALCPPKPQQPQPPEQPDAWTETDMSDCGICCALFCGPQRSTEVETCPAPSARRFVANPLSRTTLCIVVGAWLVQWAGHWAGGPEVVMPSGHSTEFPGGITIAATFDPDAAALWGATIGKEFKALGANMMLGPGLNLARVPNNGRNFE